MEDNLRYSKEGVVTAITSEKRLLRELEQHRNQSKQWQNKAELAMTNNHEELARAALLEKKQQQQIIDRIEPMWQLANQTSTDLKYQLAQLEEKLADAKRQRGSLVARQRAAQIQEHMTHSEIDFDSQLRSQDNFNRMEDKVMDMEARAQAQAELNQTQRISEDAYLEIKMETEIEAEMAELKKKLHHNS
jgi:phage shock protein A